MKRSFNGAALPESSTTSAAFREAYPYLKPPPPPGYQVVDAVSVGDLATAIDDPDLWNRIVDDEGDVNLLALQIDRDLSSRVWAGTTRMDRQNRAIRVVGQTLYDEIEKSLLQQEDFDSFEARLLKRMGVGPMEKDTGGRALRSIETALEHETRLAWNRGIAVANQQEDTVTVWNAVLDDVTTAGCWDNHGKPLDELDDEIPRHFGCRCSPRIVPDPDSQDPDWAALGQSILDDMADEREAGEGVPEHGASRETLRPSRFWSFREAA